MSICCNVTITSFSVTGTRHHYIDACHGKVLANGNISCEIDKVTWPSRRVDVFDHPSGFNVISI